MVTKRPTVRQAALAAVSEYEAVLAKWEAERVTAEAELASLQERAGEEVLANEDAAERLLADMARLRDQAEISTRAVRAAEPRLFEAKRAVVVAEAAEWEAEAARLRDELEKHTAKVEVLLEQLNDLDGARYMPVAQRSGMLVEGFARLARVPTVGGKMRLDLQRAELKAKVLRDVAAGENPEPMLRGMMDVHGKIHGLVHSEYYSDSVRGPEALVPAPHFAISGR